MNYIIREATEHDVYEIVELCKEHAAYEKAIYDPSGKAEKLSALLLPENPLFNCLVVEYNLDIIGYATYSFEYSTWDAWFYLHMDCLYLREHARGFGIGEVLIKEMAKAATAAGCSAIQWQTPAFNERAIKFYHRLGATAKQKLRFYLDEKTINKLAK